MSGHAAGQNTVPFKNVFGSSCDENASLPLCQALQVSPHRYSFLHFVVLCFSLYYRWRPGRSR